MHETDGQCMMRCEKEGETIGRPPHHEGWVKKGTRGGIHARMLPRYLKLQSGCLNYYKSPTHTECQGWIECQASSAQTGASASCACVCMGLACPELACLQTNTTNSWEE